MTIARIPAQYSGDWHDKPLRWAVYGPGDEVQKFSTRTEARLYRRIRAAAPTFEAALRAFVETP